MPADFEASSAAKILPNLKGYGLLPDLVYSMTLDSDLRVTVETYVLQALTLPGHEIRSQFEKLLLEWAGVNDVAANSHGAYVNGSTVAFLEKYFGSELSDNADSTISSRYAEVIKSTFDTVVDVLLTRFLSQSILASLSLDAFPQMVLASPLLPLSLLEYDVQNERFTGNPDSVVDWIIEFAPSNNSDKLDYYATALTGLFGLKYEYFANHSGEFKAYILSKVSVAEPEQKGLLTFIAAFLDAGKIMGGTAEADALSGTSSEDVLFSGLGNDTLNGGGGDDTYVYARGDGQDTIVEDAWNGTNDQLVFTNINASDVTLVRTGNDLTIVIAESAPGAGDAGSVLIKNTLNEDLQRGIEKIVFADGTVWTRTDLISQVAYITGTDSNDTVTGIRSPTSRPERG